MTLTSIELEHDITLPLAYNGVFCCRFWDLRSGNCIDSVQLTCPATSVELSRDRTVLTVTHGKSVSFFNAKR